MTHVMLDLETWGTTPGSAIRSIGAVTFTLDGGLAGEEFYANVDDISCLAAGLKQDDSTVRWWRQQGEAAQEALLHDPRPLHEVALDFFHWFARVGGVFVWAQGANFDPVLWEAACQRASVRVPWKFYNVRDTRTLYHAARFDTGEITRKGTYHHALDDCRHQVACVCAAYARLEVKS